MSRLKATFQSIRNYSRSQRNDSPRRTISRRGIDLNLESSSLIDYVIELKYANILK